jgi:hypothetical protein
MSFEQRFNEDEQLMLSSLPTLVGSVMSLVEGSGLATVKELISSATSVMSGSRDFAANEIISGVLPNMSNRDEAMTKARDLKAKLQAQLKTHEIDSKEELRQYVIDTCKKVNEVLAEKSNPAEADEYKKWTLNIAENVSKSASEGGFIGFGGTQIREGEKKFFEDLAAALNVQRTIN